jgi:hypothetical protein
MTIYCGVFFITDVSDTIEKSQDMTTTMRDQIKSQGIMLNEFSKMALFIVLMLANFAFFLYWGIKLLIEIRAMLINKIPKIYVFVCLCNNLEKFKD